VVYVFALRHLNEADVSVI